MSTMHFPVKDQATVYFWPCTPVHPARSLHSAAELQLVAPRTHSMFGDTAFSTAAPTLWNSLPIDVKLSTSLQICKQWLKTYILAYAFGNIWFFNTKPDIYNFAWVNTTWCQQFATVVSFYLLLIAWFPLCTALWALCGKALYKNVTIIITIILRKGQDNNCGVWHWHGHMEERGREAGQR